MPTGVLIYSICANNPGSHIFYILHGTDLSGQTKCKLKETADSFNSSIIFLMVPMEYEHFLPMGRDYQPKYISIATYYRLFLQSLLPNSISKILYLDGDIICRSSLSSLWNTDIEGHPLAAVYEIENGDGRYERLSFPYSDGYFNAGVILINVEYWREADAQKLFMSYLEKHSDRVVYHDQDVLNAVFHGKIVPLAVKYNMLNSYFINSDISYRYSDDEISEARKDPVLVHYSSHLKPWYKGCSHPFAKDFVANMKKTMWRNYKMKPFPASNFSGKISNMFVYLGLKKYNGGYCILNGR